MLVQEFRRTGTPLAVGMAGSVLTVVGALAPGSPAVHHPDRGWLVEPPWPPLSRELSVLVATGIFYAGVILLIRSWLRLLQRTASGEIPTPRSIVVVFLVWATPLVIGPPLLTRDPYSYAAQGEILSRGLDPYLLGPEVLGGEFVREVDPLWRSTASPYGPLFALVSRGVLEIARHDLLLSILVLKVVCLLGGALLALGLIPLARASGHDPSDALAVALLNPITLLHLVGGAHNEALMVPLLVIGLAIALRGHPILGVAACALGGAVKIPALAGVGFIAWHWAAGSPAARRVARVTACGAVAVSVLAALAAVTGSGLAWITLAATPVGVRSYLSPVTVTGLGLGKLLGLAGISTDAVVFLWQSAFLGLALGLALRALLRVGTLGLARATATALLWVAALSPVLFPFYMLWGLAPLAAAGLRRMRTTAVAASIVLSVALLPGARDVLDAVVALGPWWAAGILAGLGALWLPRRAARLSYR